MEKESCKILFKDDTYFYADEVLCVDVHSFIYVICATYQLDEISGKRNGSVLLYKKLHDEKSFVLLKRLKCDGIYNMKLFKHDGKVLLFSACAQAKINVYTLENDDLTLTAKFEGNESDLFLSIDTMNSLNELFVVASNNIGMISVYKYYGESFECVIEWKAHHYETWAVCFEVGNNSEVFSGADDGALVRWKLDYSTNNAYPLKKKQHEMGICSILNHPSDSNLLAYGSYDEHVRILNKDTSQIIYSVNTNGGVWRFNFSPNDENLIATASMHGGVCIINIKEQKILQNFRGHESIAYGVDWIDSTTLASCSFYDHTFLIWTYLDNRHFSSNDVLNLSNIVL
ncbi:hypothetical protein O9G_003560 [Rozella allomycis CSF55]|uniref:methylated diphthine methylhydrolase n=1 Tax=Rozella allomycis (strain CSF55) TaxID=988480 RepID=A0A075B3X1_ROZAC|nr:hypothetical protein O9G_003560 [Rozella allomycis CSF55]|eukprot:EPZ35842.1 hypothetical protein O9G_003560 [Rozella allomycis CSF55]